MNDTGEALGDAPIEMKYRDLMNQLARGIDQVLNPGTHQSGSKANVGFILMLFPFDGHEGRCNYISNAKRADVVVLLKEQIARFEGQPEIKGHG